MIEASHDFIASIVTAEACPVHEPGQTLFIKGTSILNAGRLCMGLAAGIAAACRDHWKEKEDEDNEIIRPCDPEVVACGSIATFKIRIIKRDPKDSKETAALVKLLSGFPMFEGMDQDRIRDFLFALELKSMQDLAFKPYRPGTIILKKGQPGTHLHIVIAGRVSVMDDSGNILATLQAGDVFGEMSLISGDPVGATVKAATATTILMLPGTEVNRLLPGFPALQVYLTKLLARRLAETTMQRARDLSSAMGGKLADIPAEEVLQALNLNRKTGVLELSLPKGRGEIWFRDGEIIHAAYGASTGAKGVIAVVLESEGTFRFLPGLPADSGGYSPIGSFMGILMNALKQKDEIGREAE